MRKGWKKAVSTMLCTAMILSMSSFMVSADGEPTIPETPAGDATTEVPGDEKDPEEQPPVNEEKDPADEEKDPADEEKDPADEEKDPADEEKDPADEEKDPADEEKDPADEEKDPADEEKDPSEVPGGPEQPSNSLPMAGLTPATPAVENGIMTLDLTGDGTEGNPYLVSTADDLKSAVENGGYIQLQEDINITKANISSTKNVTLNLNGQKITAENTVEGRINITGGNFILQDSAGNGSIVAEANDGGTGVIRVDGEASFVMVNGTIDTTKGTYGIGVFGNASVTVRGGTIKSKAFAISGNGTNQGTTNITVAGGMLESEDYAIYHPQQGMLTISDGNIQGAGAVAINQGTLKISGGNFTSTSSADLGDTPSGDGTANMNGAVINLGAEYGAVNATITGGTFTAAENGSAITVDKAAKNQIKVTVGEAKINGNVDLQNSPAGSSFGFTEVEIYGNVTADTTTVEIKDSTVTGDITGDNVTIDDSTSNNYVATVAGKGYESLEKALVAAATAVDKTVTLTKDVKLTEQLNITTEGVTLNLNNHTISAADGFTGSANHEKNLVQILADRVTIQNGTIKAGDSNRNVLNAQGVTGVVLEGLTLDHSDAGEGAPLIVNGSDVTMKGNNTIVLGSSSWGGINVDPSKGKGSANLTFENGSTLNVPQNPNNKPVVWIEANTTGGTVTGAENVGLVPGPDGTYVKAPTPSVPDKDDDDTDRPSSGHGSGSSSSGSNSNVSYTRDPEQDKREAEENMWKRAINKINSARDGSSLKIYTGIVDEIPDYVLDALRENNVTVTFYNQDGDEVTIPAGMAPKSLRDSWTYKQLGNYVLSLDEVVTEVEETTETTETTQPAAEQTAPATETAKPNPETGDASSSMMAIAAAAASLCGVVLLSKKNK